MVSVAGNKKCRASGYGNQLPAARHGNGRSEEDKNEASEDEDVMLRPKLDVAANASNGGVDGEPVPVNVLRPKGHMSEHSNLYSAHEIFPYSTQSQNYIVIITTIF